MFKINLILKKNIKKFFYISKFFLYFEKNFFIFQENKNNSNIYFDFNLLSKNFYGKINGKIFIYTKNNELNANLLFKIKDLVIKDIKIKYSNIQLNINELFQFNYLKIKIEKIFLLNKLLINKFYFNNWKNKIQNEFIISSNNELYNKNIDLYLKYDIKNNKYNGWIQIFEFFNKKTNKNFLIDFLIYENKIYDKNYFNNKKNFLENIFDNYIKKENKYVVINIKNFDLSRIQPLLPKRNVISGIIQSKIEILWSLNNFFPKINIFFSGKNIKIKQIYLNKIFEKNFNYININILYEKSYFYFKWILNIYKNDYFYGCFNVINKNINGYIYTKKTPLKLFKILLYDFDVDGEINSKLYFNNFQGININGKLNINFFNLSNNVIKTNFKNFFINIKFLGKYFFIDSSINGFKEKLKINGFSEWRNEKNCKILIKISGEKLKFIILDFIHIKISPNIYLEINQKKLYISGNINVSNIFIENEKISNNYSIISKDEIILDNINTLIFSNKKETNNISINSNISIIIDDNVYINVLGLKAKLQGNLKLITDKNRSKLNGQIKIISGIIHIYGQELYVRKGQLIFSGPIDKPYIDIEAVKYELSNMNHTISGIKIFGIANNSKLYIFSDPEQYDKEKFSYLINKNKISFSSFEGENILTSMIIGISVIKSEYLIQKIGQKVGIKNLYLKAQGFGNQSRIIVSGNFLKKLKIKYGIKTFDRNSFMLKINYKLTNKIYLEAISDKNQAVDVIYRFDF
ncbi:ytfN [Wigglesworthia glossinidia endosymbiont of Glossina brevipalpis]|uniref:YtfN protein n=1 Tax=Wigglesworthia glossinidia brevipalpis TaxID=36870 RepID=Q8D273_WIGBR|nr:ytfN [Wigglesworthia glossinidia endosymbiont of Glossina brevipalpis]